jgi:hypothetical protein
LYPYLLNKVHVSLAKKYMHATCYITPFETSKFHKIFNTSNGGSLGMIIARHSQISLPNTHLPRGPSSLRDGDEGMTNGPPIFAYLVFDPGRVSLERLSRPIKATV